MVLLGHSHAHGGHVTCGGSNMTAAALNSDDEAVWTPRLEILIIWLFTEKACGPSTAVIPLCVQVGELGLQTACLSATITET